METASNYYQSITAAATAVSVIPVTSFFFFNQIICIRTTICALHYKHIIFFLGGAEEGLSPKIIIVT